MSIGPAYDFLLNELNSLPSIGFLRRRAERLAEAGGGLLVQLPGGT
jgi:hypothetical protein